MGNNDVEENLLDDLLDSSDLLSLLDEVTELESAINTVEGNDKDVDDDMINVFISRKETHELMDNILKDMKERPDVEEKQYRPRSIEDFSKEIYSDAQLSEIQKGIDHRVDIDYFSDVKYSGRQMREIRYGLERGLDVSFYANVYYRERQMKEIRIGLQEGLDVSSYARLLYSATDMRKKRIELLKKYKYKDVDTISYDYDDSETGVHIYVEPGLKEAGIVLSKPLPKDFDKYKLLKLMKSYDIVHGFAEHELPSNLSNLPLQVKIPVMFATPPVEGVNGYYEFTFPISNENKPTINEDGTVDYNSPKNYKNIRRGDVVAILHPATIGQCGIDVMGMEIEGQLGKDPEPLTSDDIILSRDKTQYLSKKNGFLNFQNGKLTIMDYLVFDKDVGYADGNITFDGNIKISGNVNDNICITASGDVVISGFVQGANIVSGGDIIISGGVNADGEGSLIAKNNITSSFFENAIVVAEGNIETGYALNSDITCEGKLTTKGKKSLICGGKIIAKNGIDVGTIGSRARVETYVEIGTGDDEQEEYVDIMRNINKINNEMNKINTAMDMMIQKLGAVDARQNENYSKLSVTFNVLKEDLEKANQELNAWNEKKIFRSTLTINVGRNLYENTTVCINGNVLKIQEDKKSTVLKSEGREIVLS